MPDAELADVVRLLDEAHHIVARIQARQKAAAAPKRCETCHRPEQPWVPVQDAAGRIVGWRGPSCARRHTEAAERGTGVQLPIEQGEVTRATS